MSKSQRPLSPHLQVYKPQITSVLSITHRMTGVALAIGTVLIAFVLIAAATSAEAYDCVKLCLSTPIGKFFLLGWTWALLYHLFNGIRHLGWDMGVDINIPSVRRTGWMVIIFSVFFTVFIWALVSCPEVKTMLLNLK